MELTLRPRRRRSLLRRLVGALGWVVSLGVLALGIPTPWGAPRLGVTVVSGPSMLPTYDPGDLVLTWRSNDYGVGTPVVYGIPAGDPGAGLNVVHRIVSVRPDGTFVTQGDNNGHVDPWEPRASDVRGEVVLRVPRGGIVLRWFGSPLLLALVSGLLAGASVFGWAGRRGGPPPPGGDAGVPPRHPPPPPPPHGGPPGGARGGGPRGSAADSRTPQPLRPGPRPPGRGRRRRCRPAPRGR